MLNYLFRLLSQYSKFSQDRLNTSDNKELETLLSSISNYFNLLILGFVIALPIGILINIFSVDSMIMLTLQKSIFLVLSVITLLFLIIFLSNKYIDLINYKNSKYFTSFNTDNSYIPILLITLFYTSSQLFFLNPDIKFNLIYYSCFYLCIITLQTIFFTLLHISSSNKFQKFQNYDYKKNKTNLYYGICWYILIFVVCTLLIFTFNPVCFNPILNHFHLFTIFFISTIMSSLALFYLLLNQVFYTLITIDNDGSIFAGENLSSNNTEGSFFSENDTLPPDL